MRTFNMALILICYLTQTGSGVPPDAAANLCLVTWVLLELVLTILY